MLSALKGAAAGCLATVPMTIFMLAMQRVLPHWQRYALPPEKITEELVRRVKPGKPANKKERRGLSLVFHFSYGAAMGAFYSLLMARIALPAILKGIVFGLVVWFGSYLGLLPVMGISQSAPRQPLRRNVLMIGAHIVWGAVTGLAADALSRPR
ncbi:MAG: DUF1440 domain-containing protein [Ktedonobacteraceae bacterium]|nr:DUF1440 domain-containing protein [Ktedonobacteraceae bacterium]